MLEETKAISRDRPATGYWVQPQGHRDGPLTGAISFSSSCVGMFGTGIAAVILSYLLARGCSAIEE